MSEVIEVKGFNQVLIKEMLVKDAAPFLNGELEGKDIVKFLLTKSVEVEGKQFTLEDIDNLTMKKFKALSKLIPKILEVNGMGPNEEEDEEGNKLPKD